LKFSSYLFLGSCNHVAGLLFRIEAAVLQGITDETCAMKSCAWNVPKGKKHIKPGKLSNFLIKQDRYDKKFSNQRAWKDLQARKLEYNPVASPLKSNISNNNIMRQKIFNSVQHIIPNSTFVETYEGKIKAKPVQELKQVNLIDIAKTVNTFHLGENRAEIILLEYVDKLTCLTTNEIEAICYATQKQSDCEEWFNQRKGRITASKFKRVFTKMNSLIKDREENDHTCLVSDIMGYNPVIQTKSMKYGLAMENHVKKVYQSKIAKFHKDLQIEESGLVVSQSHLWIAVSPDLIIQCSCHGRGIVEIKCPDSIRNENPNAENYKHLMRDCNNNMVLKQSSEYHYQIQGQMAITKLEYADFFRFQLVVILNE